MFCLRGGASGPQPLSFQWYRGGVAVANATNQTLIRSNATVLDSGLYYVVVSNCAGALVGSRAVVAVSSAPYTLIGLTNSIWRYDQSGVDLGTAWRSTNYNDSSWPQG